MWKIFAERGISNFPLDKPLKAEILSDICHEVSSFLLYIHSMETFIYQDLKTASRFKDKTKIMTLGPYAACLSYILSNNSN